MHKKNRLDICSIRRGWVPNPLGEETSPLRLGDLSANYGLASHQCQRALATELFYCFSAFMSTFLGIVNEKMRLEKIPL